MNLTKKYQSTLYNFFPWDNTYIITFLFLYNFFATRDLAWESATLVGQAFRLFSNLGLILEIQMFDEKPMIGPLNWYLVVVDFGFGFVWRFLMSWFCSWIKDWHSLISTVFCFNCLVKHSVFVSMIVVSLYFLRLPFALLRFYVQDVSSNFESSRLSAQRCVLKFNFLMKGDTAFIAVRCCYLFLQIIHSLA